MTDAAVDHARNAGDARTAWTWGGALLIACAAISVLTLSVMGGPIAVVASWTRIVLFGAALVLFAFGIRGSGSVVARGRVGIVALLVLAVWPFVERLLALIIIPSMENLDFYLAWGYVSLLVQAGAAITAVVMIARAGVLPPQWRWAPLWALVAIVAPQLIIQLVLSAPGTSAQDWSGILVGLTQLVNIAAPLSLGILAIALARRRPPVVSVQVYPPAG